VSKILLEVLNGKNKNSTKKNESEEENSGFALPPAIVFPPKVE